MPSTRISIDVPEGYEAAKPFAGFINATTGSSIVIAEMPAEAFTQFKGADFAGKLASSGFANVVPGKLNVAADHIYITAEQASPAGAVSKFLLIFADAQATAMLTVNVLKADITSGKTKPADVEAMLVTARLGTEVAKALPAPFTLGYTGTFKAAGSMGGAYLYSLDGKLAPEKPDAGRAVFVVAPSINKVDLSDLATTSKTALTSMFDIDGPGAITKQGTVTIAGLDGYEIEIKAPPKKQGPEAVAYQVILKMPDGGFMRMVGTVNAADGDSLMPEFRKIAASFQIVP